MKSFMVILMLLTLTACNGGGGGGAGGSSTPSKSSTASTGSSSTSSSSSLTTSAAPSISSAASTVSTTAASAATHAAPPPASTASHAAPTISFPAGSATNSSASGVSTINSKIPKISSVLLKLKDADGNTNNEQQLRNVISVLNKNEKQELKKRLLTLKSNKDKSTAYNYGILLNINDLLAFNNQDLRYLKPEMDDRSKLQGLNNLDNSYCWMISALAALSAASELDAIWEMEIKDTESYANLRKEIQSTGRVLIHAIRRNKVIDSNMIRKHTQALVRLEREIKRPVNQDKHADFNIDKDNFKNIHGGVITLTNDSKAAGSQSGIYFYVVLRFLDINETFTKYFPEVKEGHTTYLNTKLEFRNAQKQPIGWIYASYNNGINEDLNPEKKNLLKNKRLVSVTARLEGFHSVAFASQLEDWFFMDDNNPKIKVNKNEQNNLYQNIFNAHNAARIQAAGLNFDIENRIFLVDNIKTFEVNSITATAPVGIKAKLDQIINGCQFGNRIDSYFKNELADGEMIYSLSLADMQTPESLFGCHLDDQNRIYIGYVCVDKLKQGQGIGQKLIKDGIPLCQMQFGADKTLRLWVFKNNQAAIKLYQRNGFKIVGNKDDHTYWMER